MSERDLVLGVDLGGTRIRAAVAAMDAGGPVDAGGVAELRRLVDGDAPRSVGELAATVSACLDAAAPYGDVKRVGMTVPGLVDGTTCAWVPNLPFLDGADLGGLVPLPVVVANDAHVSLLAEAVAGAAARAEDAVLLAIGTGIGSAVMAGRRIVRGSHDAACSFGWASADVNDRGDTSLGWLERHAAGPAFAQRARELGLSDAASLVDRARAGDPEASAAVASAATALGTALAGIVGLLDPQVVVFVGGVAESFDALEAPLRVALERHLPAHLRSVAVTPGTFGSSAGLHGAVVAGRLGPRWWEIPT